MQEELKGRFFGERPSNLRLVQMWMSKQYPAEKWLPQSWQVLAKGLYLALLRKAAAIAGVGMRTSPPRKKAKAGNSIDHGLVRNISDEEEEAVVDISVPFDTVTDEVERWSTLEKNIIREYRDDSGVLNEFALIYTLRNSFPLHYILFKQTASHLPHEGNSEQLFSRAGALSDDNGKMDPSTLAIWSSIGVNMAVFMPTYKQIK